MRSVFADRGAVTLAAVLLVGLEALTVVRQSYWPIFIALLALLLVGTLWVLREDLRARGPHAVLLPLAYVVSVLLFHLLVARGVPQQGFIVGATIGFLLLMARATEWAYPTWTWFFTSVTFFLFAAGMEGLTFHLRFPLWAMAGAVGAMTALLTYHVVGRVVPRTGDRVFWSALLALLLVEGVAVFAFFPLAYIAVGGVLFLFFYLLLHLLQHHLYGRLTAHMVREYVGIAALVITIIFLTAEWQV